MSYLSDQYDHNLQITLTFLFSINHPANLIKLYSLDK